MLVQAVQLRARLLVSLITDDGSAPGLLQLRCRDAATSAWSQHFHPTTEVVDLPDGAWHDVYAGCLPRLRRWGVALRSGPVPSSGPTVTTSRPSLRSPSSRCRRRC